MIIFARGIELVSFSSFLVQYLENKKVRIAGWISFLVYFAIGFGAHLDGWKEGRKESVCS